MLKKGILIIAAIIYVASFTHAATVKGLILDAANNNTPLGYVNVALTKPGNPAPVEGTTSDDHGNFTLSNVSAGTYQVEFTFVGYTSVKKQITVSNAVLDMGKIVMSESSKSLSEVQVVGQGPQMKLEIDKKVFTVNSSIASAGASTSEMLRNIPSVDVDDQGNISLRNNPNVEVWINGKPSGLDADNRAQILQQMPAESIDRVEVITNPSAKYNPEGSAGIINLILKDDRKPGYYGSVSAGFLYPNKGKLGYNGGVSINFNTSKIDAFASIGLRGWTMSGGGWNNRSFLDSLGKLSSVLKQNTKTDRTMKGPFIRAGLDYHFDKKNTIGFASFALLGSASSPTAINYGNYGANNDLLSQYSRQTTSNSKRNVFHLELNYKHEFDKKGTELSASLFGGIHSSSSTAGYMQYTGNGTVSSMQNQYTSGRQPEVELKIDYTKKFGDNTRLEAGFDGNYEQRYSNMTGTTNTIQDPTLANLFNYYERNYAAYTTFTNKWGNFGVQLGLRGEYSYITFTSDGVENLKRYFQPFPSLYLSYAFDKNDELQLNYTRRINRPRGGSINPYVDRSDTTSWSFGNPALTPEFTNSIELNYLKSWELHSLSASLYYRYTTDVIQSVRWIHRADSASRIMMNTSMNGSKTVASGLEVVIKDNFFRILNLTTTFNFFYNKMYAADFAVDSTDVHIPEQSNFSWNAKSIANVLLPANFSLQLVGSYNAPNIISQGKRYGNYSIDFGLRKSFLQRKVIVNFTVRDIFNSRKNRADTWGAGFNQQSLSYFNGRTIGLTVSYNFGSGKAGARKRNNNDPNQQNEDDNNDDINMVE